MKALLIALMALTSTIATAAELDNFLGSENGTWCFTDKTGNWDHARLQFDYNPWGFNWVKYDVTDAPKGAQPVMMNWQTRWVPFKCDRVVELGRRFSDGKVVWYNASAHVDDNDHMTWTWEDDGTVSILQRCDPPPQM